MPAAAHEISRTCYARETYWQVAQEIGPLLKAHWLEVAHYPDIALEPDWTRYEKADDTGVLRVYTARDGYSRELIGYAIYAVMPNAHYMGSIQANQDILFLKPEYRKGLRGTQLLDYSERCLAAEGVQVVYQHIKIKSKGLGRFLRLRGYEPIDEIYGKRLDR